MQLYKNKDMFRDLILRTSNHFNILPEVVEKDYFVTIILQELQREVYKSDYDNITSGLLFEKVPYSQAIEVIHKIIKNGLMD